MEGNIRFGCVCELLCAALGSAVDGRTDRREVTGGRSGGSAEDV